MCNLDNGFGTYTRVIRVRVKQEEPAGRHTLIHNLRGFNKEAKIWGGFAG